MPASPHFLKNDKYLTLLKALSGRENRWMSDVTHRVSKTLVKKYGKDTLFVLEDLTGVSFEASNLSRGAKQNYDLRSWSFYQLEQFLSYKAQENRSPYRQHLYLSDLQALASNAVRR